MVIGGVVEIFLGIDAEQQSLEDIAQPLSATTPVAPPLCGDRRTPVRRQHGARSFNELRRQWVSSGGAVSLGYASIGHSLLEHSGVAPAGSK